MFGNPGGASAFGGGGGLFGQPQGQPQQQQQSAFGGMRPAGQPAPGGLFGQPAAGQAPQASSGFGGLGGGGGGLFGGVQPQAAPQGQVSAFGGASAFGGMQQPQGQQPQDQNRAQGAFGQGLQGTAGQSAGGTGLFGQGQVAGIQPQQQASAFGGQGLWGSKPPGQPGTTMGMGQQPGMSAFGQTTQGAFGAGGSGGTGGLFQGAGQQQNPLGGGGIGAFGQQQTQQSGFNQPQKSSLFGGQQTTQGLQQPGAFGQNQSQGLGGGLFGQPAAQGLQQQPGLATQSSFGLGGGLGGNPLNQQQQPLGMGQQQPGANQSAIYGRPADYQQNVQTVNVPFREAVETVQDVKQKDQIPNLAFQNIRGHAQYKFLSSEMLRVLDMFQMKGQAQQSFEFKAMMEFNQNQQSYPQHLLNASKQRGNFSQAQGQPQAQPQQQQPGFAGLSGGLQPGAFGQQQQQQQQQPGSSLFGGTQPGASQGVGLFGQPQAQPTTQPGGLFGQPQAQPQQTQQPSSLFGAPAGGQTQPGLQQPGLQQPGGLFGNTNAAAGQTPFAQSQPGQPAPGGLFGTPAPGQSSFAQPGANPGSSLFGPKPTQPGLQQQPLGGGSGLFGQSQAKPPTSGLFQTAPQQPSAFGQQPQQTLGQQAAPGGLFGQPQAQKPATGLFGPPAQQTPMGAPGGLFSQQSTTQQQPATGLFGPTAQQQPNGGSLFNIQQPQPVGQMPTGGLVFPGQQQQQTQQQQQAFNPMSVYQTPDPFGMSSGFMSKEPESVEAVKRELEAIAKNVESQQSTYQTKLQQSERETPSGIDHWNEYGQGDMLSPEMQLGIQLSLAQKQACKSEEQRQKEKQIAKYGYGSEIYKSEIKALRQAQEDQYGSSFGYRDLSKRPRNSNASLYSNTRTETLEDRRLRMPKLDANVPDLSRMDSRGASSLLGGILPALQRNSTASVVPTHVSNTNKDAIVKLTLVFRYLDCDAQELCVEMHKSRDVSDLYDRTEGWMTEKFNYRPQSGRKFNLLCRNRLLDQKKTLKEAEVTEDSKVYVQLKEDEPETERPMKEDNQKTGTNDVMPQSNQLPKVPKAGYTVRPEMAELSKMTIAQLQNVENFKVSNEFGSVEFHGKADVSAVDLADIVTIVRGSVEVYDDDVAHKFTKPPVGQKLNRPATITLKQVKVRKGETAEQTESRLRRRCDGADGAEHLSYDSERNVWEFKVPHFTKWGDGSSEDEEDDQTNTAEQANEQSEGFQIQAPIVSKQSTAIPQIVAPFESLKGQQQQAPEQDIQMEFNQPMKPKSGFQPAQLQKHDVPVSNNNRYPGKRMHLDSDSERQSFTIEVTPPQHVQQYEEPGLFSQQLQQRQNRLYQETQQIDQEASRIDEAIRKKENLFKKVSSLACSKPSDSETIAYLRQMGLKSGLAKTSLRSGITRPCFSPNGQIAFVNGGKIQVVPIKPIEAQNTFSPASTVLKHTLIEKKNERELGAQMQRMNLSQGEAEAINTEMQFAQKMLFNDGFFYNLLKMPLPKVAFCQTEGTGDAQKVQLNRFLYDLAKDMAQESAASVRSRSADQSDKIKHEFITVCMLSALFGNPNLNLVQLHPAYSGPKSIERDLITYGMLPGDGDTVLSNEKKRRNAVCEVLRFHCQQVYKVDLPPKGPQAVEKVYSVALGYLQNGDIKSAIKYLNDNKKSRMAMMVAKGVNQRYSMDQLESYVKSCGADLNNRKPIHALCLHMSRGEDQQASQNENLPWDKELLKTILFSSKPNQSLTEMIRQKDQLSSFSNTESIMWSLLQVYAGCRDAENSLKQFSVQLTTNCSQRSFRLRWLVQLVLKLSLNLKGSQDSQQMGGIYGQKAQIQDQYFVQTSSQYVRQLLSAKDWRSALIVSLLIPSRFGVIRSKLIYEVLNLSAGRMILLKREELQVVTQKLNLPNEWLQTVTALFMQNLNLNEEAISRWIEAGNPQLAHQIWHEKLLPLYMNRSVRVSLVKCLQQGASLNQAQRAQLIRDQLICERGPKVDYMVQEFAKSSSFIQDWDSKTGNFKKFMDLLKNLSEQSNLTAEVCRSYNSVIGSIQTYSRDDDDAVDQFISQEIATIGNLLQVREDDENAKEGRDRTSGIIHHSRAGNQHRTQSDAKLVNQNKPRIARELEQLVVSQLLNRIATK